MAVEPQRGGPRRLGEEVAGPVIRLTEMEREDIEGVLAISTSLFGEDAPEFYDQETLERLISTANSFALVAYQGEQLAGFSVTHYHPGSREADIRVIAVAEESQGMGIGSRLLKGTLEKLRMTRCERVFSYPNGEHEPSRKLFEAHGFVIGRAASYATIQLPQSA